MKRSLIIGIHGLLNKPPCPILEAGWTDALAEGLRRNHNLDLRPPFQLAYWADIQYPQPQADNDVTDPYIPAPGDGCLERYSTTATDSARTVAQNWGGYVLDLKKRLFGLDDLRAPEVSGCVRDFLWAEA
jgi:hypothetical protein